MFRFVLYDRTLCILYEAFDDLISLISTKDMMRTSKWDNWFLQKIVWVTKAKRYESIRDSIRRVLLNCTITCFHETIESEIFQVPLPLRSDYKSLFSQFKACYNVKRRVLDILNLEVQIVYRKELLDGKHFRDIQNVHCLRSLVRAKMCHERNLAE